MPILTFLLVVIKVEMCVCEEGVEALVRGGVVGTSQLRAVEVI